MSSNLVSPGLRERVLIRDDYICHLCGGKIDSSLSGRDEMGGTADHIIPVYFGGKTFSGNLAAAHMICNSWRGTGLADEARSERWGWRLTQPLGSILARPILIPMPD